MCSTSLASNEDAKGHSSPYAPIQKAAAKSASQQSRHVQYQKKSLVAVHVKFAKLGIYSALLATVNHLEALQSLTLSLLVTWSQHY